MTTTVHMLEGEPVTFPGDYAYRIDKFGHLALRERNGDKLGHIVAVFPAHRWCYMIWEK